MENLLMFLATSLVLRIPKPKFKRYLIGSGCSSLLVSGHTTLHYKTTKDGDRVYFYDQQAGEATYGLITIQMKELYTLQQAEKILVQYANRLRTPLGIAHNFSIDVEKTSSMLTVTDYWQDEGGIDWKIVGHTNGKTIAFLYVKNIGSSPVKEHDAFLNGFRFSKFS
jgi:hypothetical protein